MRKKNGGDRDDGNERGGGGRSTVDGVFSVERRVASTIEDYGSAYGKQVVRRKDRGCERLLDSSSWLAALRNRFFIFFFL